MDSVELFDTEATSSMNLQPRGHMNAFSNEPYEDCVADGVYFVSLQMRQIGPPSLCHMQLRTLGYVCRERNESPRRAMSFARRDLTSESNEDQGQRGDIVPGRAPAVSITAAPGSIATLVSESVSRGRPKIIFADSS